MDTAGAPIKQHLIDPEICIRCGTCEETCPIDAVTHNDDNYVVDAEKCNYCMDCISPCPTGSIDNWRVVLSPYSLDEQFEWDELPEQEDIAAGAESGSSGAVESLDDEIDRLLAEAHSGVGGKAVAPASASKPSVNLFSRAKPATATVQGNFRLTDEDTDSDVRHIILDLGDQVFPVLEGQSVGIVPPGETPDGKPHNMRLYSVASPRDGERANTNNVALTVKREDQGLCSNYVCDLKKGDTVELTGPFGATFLMPDDPQADIIMICTGTGSAPFRGFTMRRQRTSPNADGHLFLYFGARTPETLPYFGPLKRVPSELMTQRQVFSRVEGQPKTYVQDQIKLDADLLAPYLKRPRTHIYVCGLKGMEDGVESALAAASEQAGLEWSTLRNDMRDDGRFHIETY
ncbi:MAG: benzoyl-CoA 2,3-epoxidase subunit BoxA [Pseudomonadota bacterium]